MADLRVTYRDWNTGYGKPFRRDDYDEAEARRRWEARETFFVLYGDPEHPNPVLQVEIGGDQIAVMWLDELNRTVLEYLFVTDEAFPADTLFLEQVAIKEYFDDTPLPEARADVAEAWYFHPNGKVYGVRTDPQNPRLETEQQLSPEQLAAQLEPKPAFGDWGSIIRRER